MENKNFSSLNFNGLRVLVRVDFNVPLNERFEVTDNTRIKSAIPTISKIINDGGSAIIMSHFGRPSTGFEDKYSMKHILPEFEKLLKKKVKYIDDCVGEKTQELCDNLVSGDVLLLENLRFYKHETLGDIEFARKLSQLGDFYVNDAFGTAHRAHASTTIISQFFVGKKSFGYLIENEINALNKVLANPTKPVLAIIGGAKVSSKITILQNLLPKVDKMIIGGGMAYTFIKAKGGNVGKSLVENDLLELANSFLEEAEKIGVKIYLPLDTKICSNFEDTSDFEIIDIDKIPNDKMGLDIGNKSIELFDKIIYSSNTILWNGPMGVFEFDNFEEGTKSIANSCVSATNNGSYTLVGGGDSVAAINKYNLADKVNYVSTGGGAMLEYLEGKKLPGIEGIINPNGFKFSFYLPNNDIKSLTI